MHNDIRPGSPSSTHINAPRLCERPKLSLTIDRPFVVDMERFFEFSFSFAEALLDLEYQHQDQPQVTTLERHLALACINELRDSEFDIDVRWM